MITITMPEWFTWLLLALVLLQFVATCLGLYVKHLQRKLDAMLKERSRGNE